MGLTTLLLGGGAALAAWKLWPKLCSNADVQNEALKLVKAWTDFDLIAAAAMREGKLQPTSTFVAQATNLKAQIEAWYNTKILGDLNKLGLTGPNTLACKYRQEGIDMSKALVQLSSDFARLTGYESPVKDSPMGDETNWLLWAGLAVGGYVAYRYLSRSEYIPRAQLPRYAGGSRRFEE